MKDITEIIPLHLDLPIGGKAYRVPAVGLEDGLKLARVFGAANSLFAGADLTPAELAALELDDDQERGLYQVSLGPAYDQMVEDGVPWPHLRHAGTTAAIWAAVSQAAAEEFWASAAVGDESAAENDGEAD